jgi:isoleucyl-tRNA synthetase
MTWLLKAVALGRACRNDANIKNRQPLQTLFISGAKVLPEMFCKEIEEELNVKEVKFTDDSSDFITYTFKPQLRTVGPKYGKLVGLIGKELANANGSELYKELNSNGSIKFDINGNEVILTAEDLLITPANKSGFTAQSDSEITVVLDNNLTDELIREGYMRELVSKIQTMRKETGFEVTDHIKLVITADGVVAEVVKTYAEDIKSDCLADVIELGEPLENNKEWDINDKSCVISMEKI